MTCTYLEEDLGVSLFANFFTTMIRWVESDSYVKQA